MKLHSKYRPELVVSRDETRYSLTSPYLDAEKKMIFATDGHSLVGVPVEVEDGERVLPDGEKGRYLSAHALQVTHKEKPLYGLLDLDLACDRLGPLGLSLNTGVPLEGKFPDADGVLPRLTERKMSDPIADDGTVTIAFNARYLLRIAKALGGGDQVVLTFKAGKLEQQAIQIRSWGSDRDLREIAVLMACLW